MNRANENAVREHGVDTAATFENKTNSEPIKPIPQQVDGYAILSLNAVAKARSAWRVRDRVKGASLLATSDHPEGLEAAIAFGNRATRRLAARNLRRMRAKL